MQFKTFAALLWSSALLCSCTSSDDNRPFAEAPAGADSLGQFTRASAEAESSEQPANLKNLGYAPTSHSVDIEEAKNMVRKYLTSRRYINHRVGSGTYRPDTRAVFFDRAFVDALYRAIQCERASGIRVYFGVYDRGPQQLYKTVIFTTTYDSTITVGGNQIVIHKDNLSDTCSPKKRFLETMKAFHSDPWNRGGLCPPPSDSCHYYGALLLPPNQ